MAILNYTTQINANKTIGEIQAILAKKGANQISVDYENGQPAGLRFQIVFLDQPVYFRLPCNVEGVYKSLCNSKVPSSKRTLDQARRVAWRIIKDWVEAQLAIVESNQAEMAEVFLPYAIDKEDRTFFQSFSEQRKQLTSGN